MFDFLDGTRLYVTTSLFSPWDKQFYPDMVTKVLYLILSFCRKFDGLRIVERLLSEVFTQMWWKSF